MPDDKFLHLGDSNDDVPNLNARRIIALSVTLCLAFTVMVTTLALLWSSSQNVTASEVKKDLEIPQTQPTSSTKKRNETPQIPPPSFPPSVSTIPTYISAVTDSAFPSSIPSLEYSDFPSFFPSLGISNIPSSLPTLINATFAPGFLTIAENNLLLSQGLQSRILAKSGKRVTYASGKTSDAPFHVLPDFGATFADPRNPGGWIYVSNSEVKDFDEFPQKGGVGAFTFDVDGNIVDYRMILEGTKANCGGGRTPWGAWISCEEHDSGVIWQVDPTGEREAQIITLGSSDGGGAFESFASHGSHYFVTEDAEAGPLRRFTPSTTSGNSSSVAETDPWSILLSSGVTVYLMLHPSSSTASGGAYNWTEDKDLAKNNSRRWYQNSEGIDVVGDKLFFVSKTQKEMFTLDLSSDMYTVESTVHGLFDGSPDQVVDIVGDDGLLYFTEEGGVDAGGKS